MRLLAGDRPPPGPGSPPPCSGQSCLYAINEGKDVIPVVIQERGIPFRLRPFQYADIRVSYDSGLEELFGSLSGEQQATADTTAPPEHPVVPIPESDSAVGPHKHRLKTGVR